MDCSPKWPWNSPTPSSGAPHFLISLNLLYNYWPWTSLFHHPNNIFLFCPTLCPFFSYPISSFNLFPWWNTEFSNVLKKIQGRYTFWELACVKIYIYIFYFIHSLDGFTSLLNTLFITKNLEAIASSAAGENFQVIRVPLLHVLLFHSFFGISRFLICLWCSGEQISIRMMLLRICDFHLLGNLFSLNIHFSLDFIFVSGYNDLCIFRGYLLFLFISNFIEK